MVDRPVAVEGSVEDDVCDLVKRRPIHQRTFFEVKCVNTKAYLETVCKKPSELTALSRFRSVANAELCGKSIRRPYMALSRYGYFSGSSSWSLRAVKTGDSSS